MYTNTFYGWTGEYTEMENDAFSNIKYTKIQYSSKGTMLKE
jgi:hypothetical protein